MGQSCVEFLIEKELKQMLEYHYQDFNLLAVTTAIGMSPLGLEKVVGHIQNFQGRVGEIVAASVTAKVLGIQKCGFEPGKQGFDGLGKVVVDGKERFVVVESKFTTKPGPQALDKKTGEMSKTWITSRAGNLTKESFKVCTPANKPLGEQILAEIKAARVERRQPEIDRIIVHVNPETFVTTVYKAAGMTDGPETDVWEPIEQFGEGQLAERLK